MAESDQVTNLNDLIREQIPVVMRLAVRLTGNLHEAEELVQEALLRAAKSLSSFRQEASFRTWLTRIVINVFRSRLSVKKAPTAEFNEAEHAGQLASAEQAVQSAETQDAIIGLINQLPLRQKEVLTLMTWEDHSAAEVAAVLGISIQNVYSNLSAARNTLKRSLAAADFL